MRPLRVGIVGGGPAGLYTAILLKNANPRTEVTLYERNPRGATFGFGVVLSDVTLTGFQGGDAKTYHQISAHQCTWETIETIHRGVTTRVGGHFYLGIARKRLLDILTERAEELGVRMTFEHELTDLSVFEDCDLIVAADGVNSLTRKAYNEHFRSNVVLSKSKFIWLAVQTRLPGFRFIFVDTEYGLFQAHMYPYDDNTSTCIVQCRDETWYRAGLDRLDEAASVAFCRDLLRPYLGDVAFLSNRSLWTTFQLVTTRNWSYRNILLMGDAVHTAHWNIGSGTKLAMEDALALVKILERVDDIPTALRHYQLERKPVAERLQAAGRAGEIYCENIEERAHLDPVPFTFQFMIRTPRMDYDTLKQGDPAFIASVDRWYAARAAAEVGDGLSGAAGEAAAPPPVKTPVRVGTLRLPNRIVHAQPATVAAQDGLPESAYFDRLRRMAMTGAALVLSDVLAVAPEARPFPGSAGLYSPDHVEAWREVVEDLRLHGETRVAALLGYAAAQGADPARVRDQFAGAAEAAGRAGFDLIVIDMSHGSLLGTFLSPLANQLGEPYGGSLENRLRFPLEVLGAVRRAWGDRPAGAAITVPDAESVPEAAAVARALKERGCDLLYVLSADARATTAAAYSEKIRSASGIRTLVGGTGNDLSRANTSVAGERADLCVVEPPGKA